MSALFPLSPAERLELDVDARLHLLREELLKDGCETFTVEQAAAYVRAAYGAGYVDALKAPPDDSVPLEVALGFARTLRERVTVTIRRARRRS